MGTGISSLSNFHEICRIYTSFYDALGVKIWMDLLKGLRSYGGCKLTELGSPNFQRPLAAKLCIGPQKFWRCKNVLKVLYHHGKFCWAQISPAAGAAKNVEFFVGLSVRHAFERRRFCVRFRHEGAGIQKRF